MQEQPSEQQQQRMINIPGIPNDIGFTFIGQGAFGQVYKGINQTTGELYALKITDYREDRSQGIPSQILREISALKELDQINHPNLVKLKSIIPQLDKIYMIFEYCNGDLGNVITKWRENPSQSTLSPQLVKRYLYQILSGVHQCHLHRIMHRDLKPQNILVGQDGHLKLADFGLARAFSIPLRPFTHEVVTIWYRAPELLLGATEYSIAVDMWSVGCIFFEICKMRPLFYGTQEIEIINKIFKELGTPNDEIWPGYSQLPCVKQISLPQCPAERDLREKYGVPKELLDDQGYDLLMRMLHYNPEQRIIASDALNHGYFQDQNTQ